MTNKDPLLVIIIFNSNCIEVFQNFWLVWTTLVLSCPMAMFCELILLLENHNPCLKHRSSGIPCLESKSLELNQNMNLRLTSCPALVTNIISINILRFTPRPKGLRILYRYYKHTRIELHNDS